MSAFEKVIGYEAIKTELEQILDMIRNPDLYENFGAKKPKGLLIYGDAGLGKTLMAECFIEESGLNSRILRMDKGDDFASSVTKVFNEAIENAPSVILLDDMDKYANDGKDRSNAAAYVSVQAAIDKAKNSDVFVIATANDVNKLPESLIRPGRFDRKIEVQKPTGDDAANIIRYYLSGKKLADDVNLDDVSKMMSYKSCADLEMILNEAAIHAASRRKTTVEMSDIVHATLRAKYCSPDDSIAVSHDERKKIALHEAGHLVVSEALCDGSVGLASLGASGKNPTGGFIHKCKDINSRRFTVAVSLAGKAAVELYHGETAADGCMSDIAKAVYMLRDGICGNAMLGLELVDVTAKHTDEVSENLNSRTEAVVQAELDRYFMKVRAILIKNRAFLEKAASDLAEKGTLLYSDIQKLKRDCGAVGVPLEYL